MLEQSRAQGLPDLLEPIGDEAVVHPAPPSLPHDQTRFTQDAQMMGHGGLGQTERGLQLTAAGSALRRGGQHRDYAKADRVGQGSEQPGRVRGLVGVDDTVEERGAAIQLVLTLVDVSTMINTSKVIDLKGDLMISLDDNGGCCGGGGTSCC